MAEIIITTCDVCNPDQVFQAEEFIRRQGRGVVNYPAEVAIEECDWEKRDGRHICLQCIEEREDAGQARRKTMKKTYKMTDEQLGRILEACKPAPCLVACGAPPRSPQENANDAWAVLGRELGFKPMTVKPGSTEKEFTAEPVEDN